MPATEEPVIVPDFRVCAIDTTRYWDESIRNQASRVLDVYLYDRRRHVHACSFTPSYELHWVDTIAEDAPEAVREAVLTAEHEPVKYVATHSEFVEDVPMNLFDRGTWRAYVSEWDGDRETAHRHATEGAMEEAQANARI
jgi:hypothetical protein